MMEREVIVSIKDCEKITGLHFTLNSSGKDERYAELIN